MIKIDEALVPHGDGAAAPLGAPAVRAGTSRAVAAVLRVLTLLCVGYGALYLLCEL